MSESTTARPARLCDRAARTPTPADLDAVRFEVARTDVHEVDPRGVDLVPVGYDRSAP